MKKSIAGCLLALMVGGGIVPMVLAENPIEWTLDGAMPMGGIARYDLSYYPATGLLYMLGGRLTDNSTIGDVYSFDPASQSFTGPITTMPTPVSNYQIALLNDGSNWGMYIFGGRMNDGTNTGSVQVFYPGTSTTTTLPGADNLPIQSGGIFYGGNAVVVYNNKAYVFGGFSPNATPYATNQCWVFNPQAPSGSRWTQLPNLPLAVGYPIGAVCNGFLYSFGGDTYDGSALHAQIISAKLNLASPSAWDDAGVADFTDANGVDESIGVGFDSGSSFLDLQNKIVIAGIGQWSLCTADVYVYDTVANSWNLNSELNHSRRNHGVEFVPSTKAGIPGIWVFGGYDDTGVMTDTIEYSNSTLTPVVISDFTATPETDYVNLTWRAQESVDHYGYNLYRTTQVEATKSSTTKNFVKLNDSLIVGSTPYSFVDSNVEKGKTYIYRLEAIKIGTGQIAAAAEDTCVMSAYSFAMANCFPNPADAFTNVSFTIPESMASAQVILSVYDLSGRLVTSITSAENYTPGMHNLKLNTTGWASGVYSLKLTANSESATGSMVVTH